MEIITTAAIKGGTGKTTTAAALAQAAAHTGRRALCIDLDPQANLTMVTGADPNRPGSYQLLHGEDATDLIQHTGQGLDVIAAAPDLAAEATAPASARRLQRAINGIISDYDIILIDTPPTMGEMLYNALQAATGLLIPLEADNSSLQGLYKVTDLAHQIQATSNPDLRIMGTVITRYRAQAKINRYWRDAINDRGTAAGAPLLMEIRAAAALQEAQAFKQSLFDYAPKSNSAKDYMELFKLLEV